MSTRPRDATSSAFATLRIIGNALEPSTVTRMVHLKPTFAHRKGEKIASKDGARSRVGKFGIWYFSTRDIIASPNLDEHLRFLVTNVLADSALSWEREIALFDRDHIEALLIVSPPNRRLRQLLETGSCSLVITAFWRGRTKRDRPTIPEAFKAFLNLFSAKLETDFAVQKMERTRITKRRTA